MAAPWIVLMVAVWLVVVLLAVVVLGLIGRVNQLEAAATREAPAPVARLTPGDPLPVVRGFENLTAAAETRGTKRLILFLNSTCGPCRKLADEIKGDTSDEEAPLPGHVELILVTDRDGDISFADLGASDIVTQTASEVTRAWGIPGTPFAVAVDEAGTISATGFAGTPNTLREIAKTLEPAVLR